MRNLLIALLPAALVACGATSAPAAEAPAAATQPAKQAEAKPAAPAVQLTEATGTWTQTRGANPRVTFASAQGEALFSVACLAATPETGAPMLEIQTVTAANAPGERIEIYSSSSNAAVVSNPADAPGRVLGYAETGGTAHYALARGAGELKIVSGNRATTFPTDPMLKQLIDACRPPYVHPEKDAPAAQDGETEDTAAPEDSPSGI